MSFESKTVFMNRLKFKLADILTVNQSDQTLSIVSECLSDFDMDIVERSDIQEDDLLQTYLDALGVQGRSEKTIARYDYVIKRMIESVKVPTQEITVFHLRNYLAKEKGRGISSETLEGLRQVFTAYFNWLHRENLIQWNPVANLGAIKRPKKVKEIYSDIDIEKLKQHCRSLRDKAIISFLYSTGCRISEMIQLNVSDLDFQSLECMVTGKGDKQRVVYLDAVTGMIISQYLHERKDSEDALFVTLKPPYNRIRAGGVRTMLTKLGEDAGVMHVHPHKFRRTRATKLSDHGMPIQEIAAILGHEKLDTTMKYVVMNKTNIKNAYQKFA